MFLIRKTNLNPINKLKREEFVPATGVFPPFCALPDVYCTLTGWFFIFFSRIFALEADIFYRQQKDTIRQMSVTSLVAKREAHTLKSYIIKQY